MAQHAQHRPRPMSGRLVFFLFHAFLPLTIYFFCPEHGRSMLTSSTAQAFVGAFVLNWVVYLRLMTKSPPKFDAKRASRQSDARDLPHCDACDIDRPLRTHHCKRCGHCLPLMDHHCWWSGVCIAGHNRPVFLLWLHTQMATVVLLMVTNHYMLPIRMGLKHSTDPDVLIAAGLIVEPPAQYTLWRVVKLVPLYCSWALLALFVLYVGLLLWTHWVLFYFNLTSLEWFRPEKCPYLHGVGPDGQVTDWWAHMNTFNRGLCTNARQYFFPPDEFTPNPCAPAPALTGRVRSVWHQVDKSLHKRSPSHDSGDRDRDAKLAVDHKALAKRWYYGVHVVGYVFLLLTNRIWASPQEALSSPVGLAITAWVLLTFLCYRRLAATSPGWVQDRVHEVDAAHQHGYCHVCDLPLPLRAQHCETCNRCVYTFDHHCDWLGTCIGGNNRPLFLVFLVTEGVLLLIAVVCTYLSLPYTVWPTVWRAKVVPVELGVLRHSQPHQFVVVELLIYVVFLGLATFLVLVGKIIHKQIICCMTNLTTPEFTTPQDIPYLRHAVHEGGRVNPFDVGLTFFEGISRNMWIFFVEKPIVWRYSVYVMPFYENEKREAALEVEQSGYENDENV